MTPEDLLYWKYAAKRHDGHDCIANANTVGRFVAKIEELETRLKAIGEESLEHNGRLLTENAKLKEAVEEAHRAIPVEYSKMKLDLAAKCQRVAELEREKNALEGAYSSMFYQRNELRRVLDAAEIVCEQAKRFVPGIIIQWEHRELALKEALENWRSVSNSEITESGQ